MRLSRENIEKKRANTSVLIRKADAFGAVIEAAAREESENDVLKRIDRIPPVAEANVAFLCDGRKCDSCSGECTHTLDVSHAKNFSKRDGAYFENEVQPSADITETKTCQKCQETTERILNNQGERIKALEASAEAVQGWVPCSERLPKGLEAVNVTWVNHNPPCYYIDIMNVPFTGTCVRYKGKWYWWDSTICDVLEEYGEQYAAEPINKYIEVIAWKPLPEPYKEEYDEN